MDKESLIGLNGEEVWQRLYNKELNTKFLVFDLGGGTFDISILENNEKEEKYHFQMLKHRIMKIKIMKSK